MGGCVPDPHLNSQTKTPIQSTIPPADSGPTPALTGLPLAAENGLLRVSGFDFERSAVAVVTATVSAPR